MMRAGPSRRIAIAAIIAILGLGAFWIGNDREGQDVEMNVARPAPEVQQDEPFAEDIAAVEDAWDEPIPEDLHRIGGVDWWGWARMRLEQTDDGPRFDGAYRDARVLYVGPFDYRHPEGTPPPKDVFRRYVMSHFDGTALVFREVGEDPPLDHFLLVPAEPERIQRRP